MTAVAVDTNVLVYAVDADAPQHGPSRALADAAVQGKISAAVFPQVLLEFYAVVTDPRRVRSPLEPRAAWQQVEALSAVFRVLDPGSKALAFLGEELRRCPLKGGAVFDAFLVAQMRASGLSILVTYNLRDFAGYEGVRAVTPEALAPGNC